MFNNRIDRLLFAYFERPKKEYARAVACIKAHGGLTNEEIETIRAQAPTVHAEAIIRHLTGGE